MRYAIEAHVIDPARREISLDDVVVPVEPKVFDLLIHLLDHRCRVVSKDELIDEIWDGRVISEAALSSCIKAARRALGDNGRQQRLIRTIHRRGFRFVGAVKTIAETSEPEQAGLPSTPRPPTSGASAAGAETGPMEGSTYDLDLTLPGRPSIAVMPFLPLNPDDEAILLAGGLSHDLTVRLSRTRWLFVTARASAATLNNNALDPVEVGRKLGVRYLLSGSLMVVGRRLRLTVTLCDALEGCEIWAERFDRTVEDLFAVQDEIGDLIVSAIEAEIEQKERRQALLRPLASLDAWSAYHRACHHLYRYTPEHGDQAEHFLDMAARLDPNSARVQAGLSFLHWQRAFLESVKDRTGEIRRALDHARHSIALDPLDPQAHWALGRAMLFEGHAREAVEELGVAVDLNPNFAVGQYSLAFALSYTGELEGTFDFIAKARRLSPYDPMTYAFMAQRAVQHAFQGDTVEAADWSARAVRQPNAHHHILAIAAWCHRLAGREDQAHAYLTTLRTLRPDYSKAEYFRALPYRGEQRSLIERTLGELGL